MRKWHKHPLAKILLVITAIVTPAIAAVSLVLLAGFLDHVPQEGIFWAGEKSYEETAQFEDAMRSATLDILERVMLSDRLETDGKYDPDRLVDIVEYAMTQKITGKNISGLAYRLGDLAEWGSMGISDAEDSIIVCQKTDGTYHYYWMSEFKELLENGDLSLEVDAEEQEYFLEELEQGYIWQGDRNLLLRDGENETVYIDVWTYDGLEFKEYFSPDGADDILEVVNNTPELNGKLSGVYGDLDITLSSISQLVREYEQIYDPWSEGNTNFTYLLVNKDEKKVYTNNSKFRNYEDAEKNIAELKNDEDLRYVIVEPKLDAFESNMDAEAAAWRSHIENYDVLGEHYIAAAAVDITYPVQDFFYGASENYNKYAPYLGDAAKALAISLILFVTALVWLTAVAGRKAKEGDELYLCQFDRWKTELSAALVVVPWLIVTLILADSWNGIGIQDYTYYYGGYYYVFSMKAEDACIIALYAAVTAIFFLIGYLSLVRRIKGRTLWKDSILRWLLGWSGKAAAACMDCTRTFWRHRRVLSKTIVAYGVFLVFQWIPALANYVPLFPAFLMAAADVAAAFFLIRDALGKEELKNGIREIASGNLNYQFPVRRFQGGGLSGYVRESQ